MKLQGLAVAFILDLLPELELLYTTLINLVTKLTGVLRIYLIYKFAWSDTTYTADTGQIIQLIGY